MTLIKGGVLVSGVLLGVGLLLHVVGTTSVSATVLAAGLVLLMAVPVLRIFITIAEWVQQYDWRFVTVTFVVLVELAVALLLATKRV